MKITGINFNRTSSTYHITYERDGNTYTVECKLDFCWVNGEPAVEPLLNKLCEFDWFSNGKDAVWIDREEYLIPISQVYPVLPDDRFIPFGTIRYYITNHNDGALWLNVEILNTDDDNFRADDFQFAMFSKLHWEM